MRVLAKGMKGENIKALQNKLQERGFSVGASGIDGKFGANTEKAVRAFQSSMNLWVDGKVGEFTWHALIHKKLKAGSRLKNGSYYQAVTPSAGNSGGYTYNPPTPNENTLPATEQNTGSSLFWWLTGAAGAAFFWYKRKRKNN